jgi:hypothetical protein
MHAAELWSEQRLTGKTPATAVSEALMLPESSNRAFYEEEAAAS